MENKITFKWSNFIKPTPKNLLFLVEGLKGIIGSVALSTYVMGSQVVAFWMLLFGAVLDFFAKFLAGAVEGDRQVTTENKKPDEL